MSVNGGDFTAMTRMCCIWRRSIPTCSGNVCKSTYDCSTAVYCTKPSPARQTRTKRKVSGSARTVGQLV